MERSEMKIGDLSRETKTKVVTIRYYEKVGLLASPPRSSGNYRTYDREALERLRFIRRCRDLGFSVDQIRELLELSSHEERACSDVDAITETHLAEVERKITDLQALANELRQISSRCSGGGTISNCRILDAITPRADQTADPV
ncbi:helix-turn-helix domain-containing protein [Aurantimonas sp. VKM B-3413]|uniref:MerR family transcriptional regulator n=1 Tax=Aurantimonas sp. VKM B-3413 TaxID=2779401 RepID=UPI001E29C572|nr:helix-turn-helix domain-containing protein [Aurantimonas sp. VKM B-3413]MCB8840322.1 helix-turn-helix domain-containing protein [Aurantimonas sp. VKM B-3413]